VLDGALADFDRVSKQLSGEDQRRVQQHLEALRDVEKRLDTPPPVACDPNAWTAPTATDKGTLWTSLVDIAALAMACDTTRVVTFSFDHAGGGGPALPWIGVNDDMHEISHRIVGAKPDSADYQSFIKLRVWFTELVAHFVDTLKKVTLPNGESLFDDTVVFTGSEISFNHSTPDMPYVILAGAQTPFRTGRFVQVGPKVSHSNLLVTLLHAFGSQASAIGLPQFSTGNLDAALFKA
jgi:hypothetical protein